MSAARVNWGKSEALAVGSWEGGLPSLPGGLMWRRDSLKYLGVYVSNESIVKKNWERGGRENTRETQQVEVAETTSILQRQDTYY